MVSPLIVVSINPPKPTRDLDALSEWPVTCALSGGGRRLGFTSRWGPLNGITRTKYWWPPQCPLWRRLSTWHAYLEKPPCKTTLWGYLYGFAKVRVEEI